MGVSPCNTVRRFIKVGAVVDVVLKKDQQAGTLTRGTVQRILTNSPQHPRGIKVMLEDGRVGRVQQIVGNSSDDAEPDKE